MKKLFFALCMAAICLSAVGCAGRGHSLPDLAAADYQTTLIYTYGGKEFTADYRHTPTEKILIFSAPETLRGVTAKKDLTTGKVTLSLGEISFAAAASDGFFTCTKLLDLPRRRTDGDTHTLQSENDCATLLCENGLPCRIYGEVDGKDYDVTLQNFTFTPTERSIDK